MAMIAQREREMIAQRTRDALAVARKRLAEQGRSLGNPNGAAALRRAARGNLAALAAVSAGAANRAEDLRETIADVVASGAATYTAVAAELNRREIEAPRGGCWYPTGVARLWQRLAHDQWLSRMPPILRIEPLALEL